MKEAIRGVLGETHAPLIQAIATPTAPPLLPAKATPAAIETKPADRSLDTLARMWEKARKPTSGVAYATYRTVDRFHTMVGRVPVHRITKAHIVQFKDAMVEQAVGHSAIAAALNSMRTLCAFAIGQAWIDANPATGVKLEGRKRSAKTLRPPFDTATLGRIFNSRVYTDNYRPKSGLGEAVYWLPLLGLYTGARLEELAQLHPDDIYQDAYRDATGKELRCWVLRLTDNEHHGQGVKNVHSRRRIPIHAELLNAGFIEYVERHKGQRRIFPGMKPDKHGVESGVWSKWWINQHLRKECAPTSPKMVYHSFRHTFKDVCRECGISKEVADALQGHSEGDAAGNYGGEFYPLRPLVEAMEKYEVHGITLPD
jgi:integrase